MRSVYDSVKLIKEKVQELVDNGFCTHYPGYICDKDFPTACNDCITQYLLKKSMKELEKFLPFLK